MQTATKRMIAAGHIAPAEDARVGRIRTLLDPHRFAQRREAVLRALARDQYDMAEREMDTLVDEMYAAHDLAEELRDEAHPPCRTCGDTTAVPARVTRDEVRGEVYEHGSRPCPDCMEADDA